MPAWNFELAEQEFVEAGLDSTRWVKALDSIAVATGSQDEVACYREHTELSFEDLTELGLVSPDVRRPWPCNAGG